MSFSYCCFVEFLDEIYSSFSELCTCLSTACINMLKNEKAAITLMIIGFVLVFNGNDFELGSFSFGLSFGYGKFSTAYH